MTTILADAKLGLMVADSNMIDEDAGRRWSVRKVKRLRGALLACAGDVMQGNYFIDWWKEGAETEPKFKFDESAALVLDDSGLYLFDATTPMLTRVPSGREAIGTGAIAAMAAYEALKWKDPRRAVTIACKHDRNSAPPVRLYRL